MSICLQDGLIKDVTQSHNITNADISVKKYDTYIIFNSYEYHFIFEAELLDKHLTISIFRGRDGVVEKGEIYYIREGNFHYRLSETIGLCINLLSMELLQLYRVIIS